MSIKAISTLAEYGHAFINSPSFLPFMYAPPTPSTIVSYGSDGTCSNVTTSATGTLVGNPPTFAIAEGLEWITGAC